MTARRPLAYLAGPMRGMPEFNFPAFRTAATHVRQQGYDVWSPAEHDEAGDFYPTGMHGFEDLAEHGFNLRAALAEDLRIITTEADLVVVLPGWENSKGATAEVATAKALGLPVLTYEEALNPRPVTPALRAFAASPHVYTYPAT